MTHPVASPSSISRRGVIAGLAATVTLIAMPVRADSKMVSEAIEAAFGDTPRRNGKINMTLPPLAETGNNVPLKLTVDGPMDGPERPRRVVVIATLNPRALISEMSWGPGAAEAAFTTNIRLSGTQDVIAIAELADGSLWQAQVRVLVTVGACDTLSIRY